MNNQLKVCDIIVPTYNSAAVIEETLKALWQQSVPASWRFGVVVSDDGSTDDTLAVLERIQNSSSWPFTVISNDHHGAAHARNRALERSEADTILFLGADMLLQPKALAAHAAFHEQYPAPPYAALGHVAWDPQLKPTPFMEWMTHGGPQNDFDALLGETVVDPRHFFYGSHVSLKLSMFKLERWQETFSAYGWEDLDLGRRLAARGLILKTNFAARSLHHHFYTVDDIVHRQRRAGQGLVAYQSLHPTAPLLPPRTRRSRLKFMLLQVSGAIVVLRGLLRYSGKRWATPRLFFILTTVEYWRGILLAQERQ
jgi:glycosyltransferase involved in cell wall biosynthesis